MAFAWKAAGLTYNRYISVASRVVRRSLKEDKRIAAERRGESDLRIAKWEVSLVRIFCVGEKGIGSWLHMRWTQQAI
ncbi:uncharacterized protein EI97DRAFT_430195, partial [Westerdykella ornata]